MYGMSGGKGECYMGGILFESVRRTEHEHEQIGREGRDKGAVGSGQWAGLEMHGLRAQSTEQLLA